MGVRGLAQSTDILPLPITLHLHHSNDALARGAEQKPPEVQRISSSLDTLHPGKLLFGHSRDLNIL